MYTVSVVHNASTRNTCRWISSPWYFNIHYSSPESFPGVGVEAVICDRPSQLGSGLVCTRAGPARLHPAQSSWLSSWRSPSSHADPINWGLWGASAGLELRGCSWWDVLRLWENRSRVVGKSCKGGFASCKNSTRGMVWTTFEEEKIRTRSRCIS